MQLREQLARMGVELTCVFGGFADESYADIPTVARTVGLVPPATRAERLAGMRSIADFAAWLDCRAVGLHLGFIPAEATDAAQYHAVVEATRQLCDDVAKQSQQIHLETGQETSAELLHFISAVGRENLFINFDPANMILYGTGEPIAALREVGHLVRSVHCKDALWSDRPGETWGREVPLGDGAVGMGEYLRTLKEIGYRGPLTIEREIPEEVERQKREIGQATELLRSLRDQLWHSG
jgi:sugar phosphate isomerase/epimerase